MWLEGISDHDEERFLRLILLVCEHPFGGEIPVKERDTQKIL